MRRDIYEASKMVFVVGMCAFTFGVAWAIAAPQGWGWYGAVIATAGFCAVVLAALLRVFLFEDEGIPNTFVWRSEYWDRLKTRDVAERDAS